MMDQQELDEFESMEAPNHRLKIIGAATLTVIISGLLVAVMLPVKTAPKAVEKKEEMKDVDLPKGVRVIPIYRKIPDRLPQEEPKAAVTTVIETPKKVAQATEPPKIVTAPEPRATEQETVHTHDLCQRHGMHKVITHHGKSWRCAH